MENEAPTFLYFDVSHAIDTHDWIIERSGGLKGTKDIGQIESPLCNYPLK